MSLRSRSHVKASMVLTRAGHLFIHNYIRSLLNIILKPILMVWTRFEPEPLIPVILVRDLYPMYTTYAPDYV